LAGHKLSEKRKKIVAHAEVIIWQRLWQYQLHMSQTMKVRQSMLHAPSVSIMAGLAPIAPVARIRGWHIWCRLRQVTLRGDALVGEPDSQWGCNAWLEWARPGASCHKLAMELMADIWASRQWRPLDLELGCMSHTGSRMDNKLKSWSIQICWCCWRMGWRWPRTSEGLCGSSERLIQYSIKLSIATFDKPP
jgi:hypothetical protein